MTSTPNTSTTPKSYPTEWSTLEVDEDHYTVTEVRQTSEDTFQLRNSSSVVTINREGFNLYRENNQAAWLNWIGANDIESVPRTVFDD